MKNHFLNFLILLLFFGCSSKKNKIDRDGEPPIYYVQDDDEGMNEAIKKAISTINQFNEALTSTNPNYYYFAIKTPYKTEYGDEHIWVEDVELRGNQYIGVVGNVPESITEIQYGDTIQISKDQITDWMFIDNDTLRGGFTIQLLRERMTEEERKQFDVEFGIIVE